MVPRKKIVDNQTELLVIYLHQWLYILLYRMQDVERGIAGGRT